MKWIVQRMNERYKVWRAMKSVLTNRGLGINAKKYLYEGAQVPTALYEIETQGMRSSEKKSEYA